MALRPLLVFLAAVALADAPAAVAQTPGAQPSAVPTPPGAASAAKPASGPTADEMSLGLIGPETPAALREVVLHPYATPDPADCPALIAAIAALDAALGPDFDVEVRGDRSKAVGDAAKGAINGLVPYGDILRWATGAKARQKARAHAVLAGTARRGFLRGLALSKGCELPKPPPAVVPPPKS
jgi:hypothetical protein